MKVERDFLKEKKESQRLEFNPAKPHEIIRLGKTYSYGEKFTVEETIPVKILSHIMQPCQKISFSPLLIFLIFIPQKNLRCLLLTLE